MSGGLGAYPEHHFRRVIPGELEAVRRKLADVLEDFHYIVLSDNPIQAKRAPQKNIWVANILEYDTRLTIGLKAISSASTLATFDYAVPYIFVKGDRQALEREADAIIALAAATAHKTVCPSCQTDHPGAVRFCRVCGTPITRTRLPAELEVMRMTADVSAAQVEGTTGLVIQFLTLASALPMILFGKGEVIQLGWWIFAFGELLTLLVLLAGIRRLKSTVNPPPSEHRPLEMPPRISADDRPALSPQPQFVTEGTTELIHRDEAPIAVKPAKNTDAV